MRHDQNRLTAVAFEQFVNNRQDPIVNGAKGFAAGIAEFRGVGVETSIAVAVEAANGLPVETLPAAYVALGQFFDSDWV